MLIARVKAWRARRRWQREQPAREAWVTLHDAEGAAVATVPTVLVPTEVGAWVNERPVTLPVLRGGFVASIVMVDADGKRYDVDLTTHSLDDVVADLGIDED